MAFYAENPQMDMFGAPPAHNSPAGAKNEAGPPTEEELKKTDPPEWMLSTLDESTGTTFKRELLMMCKRTAQVLWICKSTTTDSTIYETYDFVGPIFWLTLYSSFLAVASDPQPAASTTQAIYFSTAFGIYFIIGTLVAFNTNVVGGKVHSSTTLCFLGYCLMPFAIYTFISAMMRLLAKSVAGWIRSVIIGCAAILATLWSTLAAFAFFKNLVRKGKVFMVLYPVILFFIVFAMLGLIGAQLTQD